MPAPAKSLTLPTSSRNLYLVENPDDPNYEEDVAMVVAAYSVKEARVIAGWKGAPVKKIGVASRSVKGTVLVSNRGA